MDQPMNEWLTAAEAGAVLGVGPDRVSQLVRQGVLPAMRTPGGHVRVRRDKVEALANPPAESAAEPTDDGAPEEREGEPETRERRPKWETVAPWRQRVHEAEADLKVLELDEQRDRVMEARAERQAAKERDKDRLSARAVESDRLRKLRERALHFFIPWGVPPDVRARAARHIEQRVTSERYPQGLGGEYVDTLLRGDIERALKPWREQEAVREREERSATEQKKLIDWAVIHVRRSFPKEWNRELRSRFERELCRALRAEYEAGMSQDDMDDLAFDFLDEWTDESEEDDDDEELDEELDDEDDD